jgi:predicted nucleotidyltransferase
MGRTVMLNKFREVMGAFPEIRKAWLFGSFAREENTIESDIDILIDVSREFKFTLFDIAEIQTQLNQLTGRKIDVVMSRALKPHVKDRIQNDLKLFYEA